MNESGNEFSSNVFLGQKENLTGNEKEILRLARERIVPILIGFNEVCHRYFEKQEKKPDVLIFPKRDGTYMGRVWRWLYPEDADKVKILPYTRATVLGPTYEKGNLSAYGIDEYTRQLSGVERVAIIDVGYTMTIPYFLRRLGSKDSGVKKDFIPPKTIWALAINARNPGRVVKEGEGVDLNSSSLPGNLITHDVGTMLGQVSPFRDLVSKITDEEIVQPHKAIFSLELLLGNTQRPILGYDKKRGITLRDSPRLSSEKIKNNPLLATSTEQVSYFRQMLLPIASTVRDTINSDPDNSLIVKEIKGLNNRQLVKYVYQQIKQLDKEFKKTSFFKKIKQLRKQTDEYLKKANSGCDDDQMREVNKYLQHWLK